MDSLPARYTPLTSSMDRLRPDLGADMAEVRSRVFGHDGPLRSEGGEQFLVGLDLNEEEHVAALEDPALLAHMEAARHRLADHERALKRLPALEALRTSYLKSVGALSTLVRDLRDRLEAERVNVEVGHRQGHVLAGLAGGRDFPALGAAARSSDPSFREAMKLASEEASVTARAYESFLGFVEDSQKATFILRRDVENFGQGLLDLVEAAEDDRRSLKEYLVLLSRAPRVPGAHGKAEAAGCGQLAAAAPAVAPSTAEAASADEQLAAAAPSTAEAASADEQLAAAAPAAAE